MYNVFKACYGLCDFIQDQENIWNNLHFSFVFYTLLKNWAIIWMHYIKKTQPTSQFIFYYKVAKH